MRVIAGSARGRQLAAFVGREIRPTPDRAREALFSILCSRRGTFVGCTVLDLFAGSGALGIEALSRGALRACFVDSSRQAHATITANLARCGLQGRAAIIPGDVWATLPALADQGPFELIFADPPYGRELGPRLLAECSRYRLLAATGILCLETAPADPVPSTAGTLRLVDQRRYGSTTLHLFQTASEEQA